jgi:tetratricopeptide (TPR) repeat protein
MRILQALIFVVSILSVYAHYLNNESSELQAILYEDFRTGNYLEESTARFNTVNLDFPNLSLSALPMKGIVAQYYFLGARFNEALDLLNQGQIDNPYIMFSESVKSEIFYGLKMKDSAVYYAEKAFTGIPKNQKHFIELARVYVLQKENQRIDSIFKIVEKTKVPEIWLYYLSSMLADESYISEYTKQVANEAREIFNAPDTQKQETLYPQIRLAANYVLIGKENVDLSLKYDDSATANYNKGNYKAAAELYSKAAKANPYEYTFFENAGVSYFQAKEYQLAIENLKVVSDSLNPKTGKSEFVLAQSYFNQGDSKKACDYVYKSTEYDYVEAYKLIGMYCITDN